jgi:hypothetical protein
MGSSVRKEIMLEELEQNPKDAVIECNQKD